MMILFNIFIFAIIIIIIIIIIITIIVVLIMMMRRRVQYTVKLCRISLVELHPILLLLHVNVRFTEEVFTGGVG